MRLLLDTNVFLEILLEQDQAAENNDLTLVSLDGDFDRTERGRQTLAQIVGGVT